MTTSPGTLPQQFEPAQQHAHQPAQLPKPPLRIAQSILHLAVLGTLGWLVLGTLIGVAGTGFALVFVVGIGLVVLVGVLYAMFGIAWFETARVAGLFGLDIAAPAFEQRREPTFGSWVRALGRQLGQARMWWALMNFAIQSLLGTLLVIVAQGLVWTVATLITPGAFTWSPLGLSLADSRFSDLQARGIGALGIVATIGIALALALLHRTLSLALIASPAREAALTEAAQHSAQEAEHQAARAHESAQQREGAVRAADVERTRIERDLHDGVQPRLVSVAMTLGLAQQQIDTDPAAAKELISEAHTSTKAAITELRQLARGIHASVLDDRGLDAALSALASRSHVPVTLDVRMHGRVDRAAESAVYFVIAECLTNAAKHSRASECRVAVRVREGAAPADPSATDTAAATHTLWARVEDDGIGGAEVQPGGGLDGISNRVRAAGGTIRIDSPVGGPTAVEVSVPCAF